MNGQFHSPTDSQGSQFSGAQEHFADVRELLYESATAVSDRSPPCNRSGILALTFPTPATAAPPVRGLRAHGSACNFSNYS